MKKILFVALALALTFAFASCDLTGGGSADPSTAFINAVNSTDPTTATINTVTTTELGTLNGEFNILYGEGGTATINYSYEQWYKIGEGNGTDLKYTVTGIIERQADGTYTDGKGFTGTAGEAAGFTLNLSGVVANAQYNEAKDTLTATVAAADTQGVFGFALGYDANLTVVISNGAVETITVTYADGTNSGSITCRYR